jgi:hypothetical protein
MKTGAIVKTLFNELNEVLTGFRGEISMNHDIPVAQVGLHLYESFEFLFFYAFVYFLADLVLFEIPERCCNFI